MGFQLKASEIQVKCPYLHDLLYDNEYEAALWMCFDANKQYLGSGDVIKDVRKTIFRFYLSDSLFLVFIKIRKRRFCYSNANST